MVGINSVTQCVTMPCSRIRGQVFLPSQAGLGFCFYLICRKPGIKPVAHGLLRTGAEIMLHCNEHKHFFCPVASPSLKKAYLYPGCRQPLSGACHGLAADYTPPHTIALQKLANSMRCCSCCGQSATDLAIWL